MSALVALLSSGLPAPGAAAEIVSHDVRLRIDLEQRLVSGRQTIHLSEPVDELTLPDGPFEIERAHASGKSLVVEPTRLRTSEGSPPFDEVTILYTVRAPRGLVFGDGFVFTGFATCTWMICEDDPGERAALTLGLTVAADEDVVASGALESVSRSTDHHKEIVWTQTAPYPAYLYGFIAGRLNRLHMDIDGRRLVQVSPTLSVAELRRIADSTRGMIAFVEDKAGLEIPGGTYTQVIVPGSAAQEKSTLSFLGTDQLAALGEDPTEDWVIIHELAHQFWGNLVTHESWTEMWLSEGMATFMTAAWKEHRWGRAKYDREMELARRRLDGAAEAGYDVPLAWDGEYPDLATRRAVTYSGGALFLDELRRRLGDDAFWTALRSYTREHAGGSVTSRDFQRAIERAASSSADRDALRRLCDRRVHPD